RAEVEALAMEMKTRGVEIAAAPQGTIAGALEIFRRQSLGAAPFEQLLAGSAADGPMPYYSTGVFLCRSQEFLERWSETSRAAAEQAVLDQNVFNAIVYRGPHPVLPLDIDLWQAQGETLE